MAKFKILSEIAWIQRVLAPRSAHELGKGAFVLFLERFFKLDERQTTIKRECYCGVLHFISVGFILSVNSKLLSENAGYRSEKVAAATALSTGFSCLICGMFSNLPFVLAPTTSTSLYFALYLQNRNMSIREGNAAVLLLAVLFTLCGYRPIAKFITNIIPFVMKVGVCLGVGLLIALEALFEIGLVQTGEHTVLDIGEFNTQIYVAMLAFVVIGLSLHYHVRGAFLIGLLFGTLCYWMAKGSRSEWPPDRLVIHLGDISGKSSDIAWGSMSRNSVYRLVFDLFVIGVILLNGLAHGLAETANLKRPDSSLPRAKWIYASCGVGTLLSAFIGSGPIMISPESAPGIKAGARTGLSAVVCGLLFLLSLLFCPLFAAVPTSGTSPVLLMIGMFMFENAGKVNWSNIREALPVFVMAIVVPFTYSIFNGVIFGFGMYAILLVVTEGSNLPQKCRRKWMSVTTRHIRSWATWGESKKEQSSKTRSDTGRGGGSGAMVGYSYLRNDESSSTLEDRGVRNSSEPINSVVGADGWSRIHTPGEMIVEVYDSDGDENSSVDSEGVDEDSGKRLTFLLSEIGPSSELAASDSSNQTAINPIGSSSSSASKRNSAWTEPISLSDMEQKGTSTSESTEPSPRSKIDATALTFAWRRPSKADVAGSLAIESNVKDRSIEFGTSSRIVAHGGETTVIASEDDEQEVIL